MIVGSSSSNFLKDSIINAAGNNVRIEYEAECKKHPNSILITTSPGNLPCKQICFVTWKPDKDEDQLQQSLNDMVTTVVQNLISHNFTSVAFPAIGCGLHNCSVPIVVRAIVSEIETQLMKRNLPWLVKFVIEYHKKQIYDEFCKYVLTPYDGKPDCLYLLRNYNSFVLDLMEAQTGQIPPTWETSKDNQLRFVLSTTCDEYKSVILNFDQHMTGNYTETVQIERIQNKQCYLQYLAYSKDLKKRLNKDTEMRLYHGCPEEASDSIINGYFNRSFVGVNGKPIFRLRRPFCIAKFLFKGSLFGKGVYFSSNASYSHTYATPNANGERFMFVARVLVGLTTQGDSSMKTAPVGFNSTTNGNHIFVTYHDAQAMAEYLITYK